MPILAVANTAIRYLLDQPAGDPTPDDEPPGTAPTQHDALPDAALRAR